MNELTIPIVFKSMRNIHKRHSVYII